jgi:hypothetical protein
MLIVPKINPNVTVTLNIGLAKSLNWGGYKAQEANHGKVQTLVDVLDAPHRIARIIEDIRDLAYHPHNHYPQPCQPYGIDYGHDDVREVKYKVVQSGTEATLVVQFEAVARDIIGQVFALSEKYKQDCIAVWLHNDVNGGIGQLIGRYNYVWSGGYFNPEYFIHLN